MHNIAICLLTCELDHLEEWYFHHKKLGFENFFVYIDAKILPSLNNFNQHLISEIKNVKTIITEHENVPLQRYIYTAFCKKYNSFDYVLFIDSDEYYQSKTNNIQEDILFLKREHGNFDALGLLWRNYGANPPFENRVPVEQYKQWHKSRFIKSLVNPKAVNYFVNAHTACLNTNSLKYIAEYGETNWENGEFGTPCKAGYHSSEHLWIKHVRFRSKAEFNIKFNRTGWYKEEVWYHRNGKQNEELFNNYNSLCIFNDDDKKSLTPD